jgi:hypothetical protein
MLTYWRGPLVLHNTFDCVKEGSGRQTVDEV